MATSRASLVGCIDYNGSLESGQGEVGQKPDRFFVDVINGWPLI